MEKSKEYAPLPVSECAVAGDSGLTGRAARLPSHRKRGKKIASLPPSEKGVGIGQHQFFWKGNGKMASQLASGAPVVVFEQGGHVYVYSDTEVAGGSIEAMDVREGFYTSAFITDGEILELIPGELSVKFARTGVFNLEALREALLQSRGPEAAHDPTTWARAQLDQDL
jgi:hypothetical protein